MQARHPSATIAQLRTPTSRRSNKTHLLAVKGMCRCRPWRWTAPSAAAALAAAPLLSDDRTPSPLPTVGQLTATELDVATRLASLTPEDLGTAATTLTLRLLSDFGFVVEATGPSIEWSAVFGIYSATIRPTSMIPGQVRLLRSLLAGRETGIGWVILADDQAGTYTVKGVRPPPPAVEPSPSLKGSTCQQSTVLDHLDCSSLQGSKTPHSKALSPEL